MRPTEIAMTMRRRAGNTFAHLVSRCTDSNGVLYAMAVNKCLRGRAQSRSGANRAYLQPATPWSAIAMIAFPSGLTEEFPVVVPKSKRPRRRAIYGITRVDDDHKHMHCWIVHLQRKRRIWHRAFSDGVHGGKSHALEAARAFREKVLASHLPMTRAEYAAIRRKNNLSGVPGVHRRDGNAGTTLGKRLEPACWIAFWTLPDGKRAIRKFSIGKYGERSAFKHAKAARQSALAAMDGLYATGGLKRWLQQHAAVSRP